MMKVWSVCVLAGLLCMPCRLTAQGLFEDEPGEQAPPPEAGFEPPEAGFEGPPPGPMPPPEGMPPPDESMHPPPGPHLDRWLARLREKRPEEYEQLIRLREADPAAFRDQLHNRLREERFRDRLKDHPGVYERLKDLPPEERDWLMHGAPRGPQGPWQQWRERRVSPEIAKLEKETRETGRRYREVQTDEERTKLRADLHAKLEELFDLREAERAKKIEQIEKQLASLRGTLETRKAQREQIIDRRLQELTDGDTLAW